MPTILQIDERTSIDLDVEILWIKETDETFVHVNSRVEPFLGEFNIPCPKSLAHDVFEHPFVNMHRLIPGHV